MKNANMGFNPEGISSINKLLEAKELTGQMPETMPTGLEPKNRENNGGDQCANFCDCTFACNCSNDCNGN